jgi:hypothetical protein
MIKLNTFIYHIQKDGNLLNQKYTKYEKAQEKGEEIHNY